MDREIKFRAWNPVLKRMSYNFEEINVTGDNIVAEIDCGKIVVKYMKESGLWVEAPTMQFTGLKDRNGKDIYEGDILATWNNDEQYDVWDKPDFGYTVVEWDSKYTCFQGSKWMWEMNNNESVYDIQFVEVIGNIYENPSLLEVTNE